jgi:hypothetical protein
VVETVDVDVADTSEARDDADASESSVGLRMRSYSSSFSCVLIVVVVANEGVDAPALPFPPNISIVHIEVFEPIEPSVSRISFASGFGATYPLFSQVHQRGMALCLVPQKRRSG